MKNMRHQIWGYAVEELELVQLNAKPVLTPDPSLLPSSL